MYQHTVVIFAGSSDPIKVTHYNDAERIAYESALPADATIAYSGSNASAMRQAFNAARSAPAKTEVEIDQRIQQEANLRASQPVCKPNEIHTLAQIEAIAKRAYW